MEINKQVEEELLETNFNICLIFEYVKRNLESMREEVY
jgi:hypothetical protein